MDVFEVIQEVRRLSRRGTVGACADPHLCLQGETTATDGSDDAPEVKQSEPLEGTSEEAVSDLPETTIQVRSC